MMSPAATCARRSGRLCASDRAIRVEKAPNHDAEGAGPVQPLIENFDFLHLAGQPDRDFASRHSSPDPLPDIDQGIIPHSKSLLTMGAETLAKNAWRILGSVCSALMARCSISGFGWLCCCNFSCHN